LANVLPVTLIEHVFNAIWFLISVSTKHYLCLFFSWNISFKC